MSRLTAPPAARLPARPCCWPRPRTTSTSMATRSRSGGRGSPATYVAIPSLGTPPGRASAPRDRTGAPRAPSRSGLALPPGAVGRNAVPQAEGPQGAADTSAAPPMDHLAGLTWRILADGCPNGIAHGKRVSALRSGILPLSTLWHSAPGAFRTGTVSVSYMTRRVKHPHTERPDTGRHDVGQVAEVLGRRAVRDLDRPELSLELRADTRPALRAPTRSRCLPEVPLISLATHLRRLAPYVQLTLTHPAAPAGDVERETTRSPTSSPSTTGPTSATPPTASRPRMSPRFR
jgi:hypothetical protein